jgi:hypothetical protein
MATLQINASAKGTAGKINVDIVSSDIMPVTVYYALDSYNTDQNINWVAGAVLNSPGNVDIVASVSDWYLVQAVGLFSGEVIVSNVEKVNPQHYADGFSVDVIRKSVMPYDYKGLQAYRLRIEVLNGVNMTTGIFLYEKVPEDYLTGTTADNFVAVCKPGDLFTYPNGQPKEGQVPPFFRLSTVDLLDENIEKLEELADAIESDIRALVRSLQKNVNLRVEDAYTVYGNPVGSSSSSSRSLSSSSSSSSYSSSSSSESSSSNSSSSSSSL